jgi:hypothetical protein
VLRQAAPDLTTLSDATRPFDGQRVKHIVTGHMRRVPPQWPSQMPYWRNASPSDLDALVTYLESVQRHPYGSSRGVTLAEQAALGAPLFDAFCASCHGTDGQGRTTGGLVIGIAPPDLTLLAVGGGGTLDMRRLFESIARHRAEATTMPGWRQLFLDMGWPGYTTERQIEDIAWYIESIQRR